MDFDGPRLLELLGSPAEVRRHYCASCSWRTAPYMHDSSLTVLLGDERTGRGHRRTGTDDPKRLSTAVGVMCAESNKSLLPARIR